MASDDAYSVGDVLYVVIPGKIHVLPVRVIESNLKTTISGAMMTYTIQDPNGKTGTLKESWNVFRKPDDVRDALYANAQKSIDDIVFKSVQLADAWEQKPIPADDGSIVVDIQDDPSIIGEVELPNGQIAKLKKPGRLG